MKKKVLHLLASNSYSGAENVVCTIIDNCSDKYDMYYCSLDGPIRDVLAKRKIKFIPINKLSVKEVRKIVKKYKIDIVHAHDFKASLIASFLDVKVISHLHCDYNMLSFSKVIGMVYSVIQKRFNKIVVVSNEILESASFKNKIINKTSVISNVLDSKVIINKSNEFNTSNYDLIFVGRLIPLKQPLLFIDIVNELKKNNSNIKACMIGNGELYDVCKNKIINNNLEDNIDLLGFKDNPFPYVKNSKVAVLPSTYEGLGLVAVEAMILGRIVVNSGVGGLKSMFNGYEKYICHKKEEYVECINELLKLDKVDYKKDCDKMIKSFIDVKSYKKSFIDLYREVLK